MDCTTKLTFAATILLLSISACGGNGTDTSPPLNGTAAAPSDAIEAVTNPQATADTASSAYQPAYDELPESLRILYVGNSYMAYVPTIDGSSSSFGVYHQINSLIRLAGIAVTPNLRSIGGGTLQQHWEAGNGADTPRSLIESGAFDLLIMQGRYDIHESRAKASRFDTYADQFANLANENNMKAVLFGLWATDNWISPKEDTFGPVAHEIYRGAAERGGISYAPNGMAYLSLYGKLANVLSEQEIEDSMTADLVHPTASLAYLAANVVYQTLFGRDAPGLEVYRPPGITDDIGALARSVAREAVAEYAYSWR